jgi:hypothetical protein
MWDFERPGKQKGAGYETRASKYLLFQHSRLNRVNVPWFSTLFLPWNELVAGKTGVWGLDKILTKQRIFRF